MSHTMYFWQSTCLKSWLLMLLFGFVPLHTLSQSIEHHVVHIIDGIEAGQSGKDIYCKRYPIRHDGMTKTTVDGMGTILLPMGQ